LMASDKKVLLDLSPTSPDCVAACLESSPPVLELPVSDDERKGRLGSLRGPILLAFFIFSTPSIFSTSDHSASPDRLPVSHPSRAWMFPMIFQQDASASSDTQPTTPSSLLTWLSAIDDSTLTMQGNAMFAERRNADSTPGVTDASDTVEDTRRTHASATSSPKTRRWRHALTSACETVGKVLHLAFRPDLAMQMNPELILLETSFGF